MSDGYATLYLRSDWPIGACQIYVYPGGMEVGTSGLTGRPLTIALIGALMSAHAKMENDGKNDYSQPWFDDSKRLRNVLAHDKYGVRPNGDIIIKDAHSEIRYPTRCQEAPAPDDVVCQIGLSGKDDKVGTHQITQFRLLLATGKFLGYSNDENYVED